MSQGAGRGAGGRSRGFDLRLGLARLAFRICAPQGASKRGVYTGCNCRKAVGAVPFGGGLGFSVIHSGGTRQRIAGMVDSDKPIGFLAFKRDEDGDIGEFAVFPDKDRLEEWKAGSATSPDNAADTSSVEEAESNSNESTPSSRDIIRALIGPRRVTISKFALLPFKATSIKSSALYLA
jgi:hypothetical protein